MQRRLRSIVLLLLMSDGRFIEEIGYYDPTKEPTVVNLDADKAKTWLKNGAQPTDTVKVILKKEGVL